MRDWPFPDWFQTGTSLKPVWKQSSRALFWEVATRPSQKKTRDCEKRGGGHEYVRFLPPHHYCIYIYIHVLLIPISHIFPIHFLYISYLLLYISMYCQSISVYFQIVRIVRNQSGTSPEFPHWRSQQAILTTFTLSWRVWLNCLIALTSQSGWSGTSPEPVWSFAALGNIRQCPRRLDHVLIFRPLELTNQSGQSGNVTCSPETRFPAGD